MSKILNYNEYELTYFDKPLSYDLINRLSGETNEWIPVLEHCNGTTVSEIKFEPVDISSYVNASDNYALIIWEISEVNTYSIDISIRKGNISYTTTDTLESVSDPTLLNLSGLKLIDNLCNFTTTGFNSLSGDITALIKSWIFVKL